MPIIETQILVKAPIERVFDLNRSVDLHTDSTYETSERAVAGVTKGLLSTTGARDSPLFVLPPSPATNCSSLVWGHCLARVRSDAWV